MIMIVCTYSFLKEYCFNTWNKVQIHHFPHWPWNDVVQYVYLWSAHPRQGLLVVSNLWDHPLGTGLVTETTPSGTTIQRNNNYTHAAIILALLFNHIFKFTFKYVNHPHYSNILCLNLTIPFFVTCLKTNVFKTIWNPYVCMEWMHLLGMNVSLYIICMYDMNVPNTTTQGMFGYITYSTTKRVKQSFTRYTTHLSYTFQELQAYDIHVSFIY